MLDIGTQKPQGKPFAINLAIRNAKGEVTRYRYFEAESAAELFDIWQKNSTSPGRKKKAETEV